MQSGQGNPKEVNFRGPMFHWAAVILGACFVNFFINYSARLGYSVFLPEMISDLGLTRTEAGTIFNAYLFTYISLAPLSGLLTDRLGARSVISICALLLGVGLLLMGKITSLWSACLAYAVVGVGATGMWAPILALVQRWIAPSRRGLALGVLSTGYGLGFATVGLVFPWVNANFGWRYGWYFFGFSALFMAALNAILLRNEPETSGYLPWGSPKGMPSAEPELKSQIPDGTQVRILRERTFWLIGLSYFSISCSLYGITTFIVDYARYQVGLPLEKASLLATIHGVSQIAGVLIILPISDTLGRKRMILISNAFICASILGILLQGDTLMRLFALVGIMAVFYGATFPIYGACAGDYFPRNLLGTVIGFWTPFYGFGAIVAHWVGGFLRDATGVYTQSFAFSTAMALAGLLLFLPVKKAHKEP